MTSRGTSCACGCPTRRGARKQRRRKAPPRKSHGIIAGLSPERLPTLPSFEKKPASWAAGSCISCTGVRSEAAQLASSHRLHGHRFHPFPLADDFGAPGPKPGGGAGSNAGASPPCAPDPWQESARTIRPGPGVPKPWGGNCCQANLIFRRGDARATRLGILSLGNIVLDDRRGRPYPAVRQCLHEQSAYRAAHGAQQPTTVRTGCLYSVNS